MHKECEQRNLKKGNKTYKLGKIFNLTKSQRNANQNYESIFWSTVLLKHSKNSSVQCWEGVLKFVFSYITDNIQISTAF